MTEVERVVDVFNRFDLPIKEAALRKALVVPQDHPDAICQVRTDTAPSRPALPSTQKSSPVLPFSRMPGGLACDELGGIDDQPVAARVLEGRGQEERQRRRDKEGGKEEEEVMRRRHYCSHRLKKPEVHLLLPLHFYSITID
jgi:hypothetical protein